MRLRLIPTAVLATAVAATILAGCSSAATPAAQASAAAPSAEPMPVVANFYPIQWLAESIGGNAVTVTNLTPVGAEPHDLALDAPAREALEKATVVFYLGASFQPDVEKAISQLPGTTTSVDLLDADGVELLAAPADLGKESLDGNKDPHVWLDPVLMTAMADTVADALKKASPDQAEAIAANHNTVVADLQALNTELAGDLENCKVTTVVTSHAAFQYLATRYGLTQLAIAGLSPDEEPDPATLREIAAAAKSAGVTTVFFEEQLPGALSETVANEIGAKVDLLAALEFDPREVIGPDADYINVMSDNGDRLSRGLSCA